MNTRTSNAHATFHDAVVAQDARAAAKATDNTIGSTALSLKPGDVLRGVEAPRPGTRHDVQLKSEDVAGKTVNQARPIGHEVLISFTDGCAVIVPEYRVFRVEH